MKKNSILEERRKLIANEISDFVNKSFEISDRIHLILQERNLDQKDLARLLGKNESEISKWMTGTHNFTIKTISRIENVLEAPIIDVVETVEISQTLDLSFLQEQSAMPLKISYKNKGYTKNSGEFGINREFKKATKNLS